MKRQQALAIILAASMMTAMGAGAASAKEAVPDTRDVTLTAAAADVTVSFTDMLQGFDEEDVEKRWNKKFDLAQYDKYLYEFEVTGELGKTDFSWTPVCRDKSLVFKCWMDSDVDTGARQIVFSGGQFYYADGAKEKVTAVDGEIHLYVRWKPAAEEGSSSQTTPSPAAPSPSEPAPVVTAPPAESITILKAPTLKRVKAAKRGAKAEVRLNKLKKQKKSKKKGTKALSVWEQVRNIEIQYGTDPSFAGAITKTVGKRKESVRLSGLQSGATYYVRARYADGKGGYSIWSAIKQVTIKSASKKK